METKLLDILINRLRLIPVEENTEADSKKKLIFLSELAALGFSVENPGLYSNCMLSNYEAIIASLKKMRGGDVDYVPLFQGFPENIPDDDEYFAKRIIGYLGNVIGLFDEGRELDNGIRVPEWLFDLEEFGADPITQFQDAELFEKGVDRQEKRSGDKHREWILLRLVPRAEVDNLAARYLQNVLSAKSSIPEYLKEDIEYLLGHFGSTVIDTSKVVFKETCTYLTKFYWKRQNFPAVAKYIRTSTDILRLFAALTDSDISLAAKITFPKLRRLERRFVLRLLDAMNNPVEDMNRYRGLWKQIGRVLHAGEYASTYPRAYSAFYDLRRGTVVTYNSRLEAAFAQGDINTLISMLQERPGVFARKLHHVLALCPLQGTEAVRAFQAVAQQVELKNLLVMDTYFRTIEDSDYRAIINKRGRIRVMSNVRNRVMSHVTTFLVSVIQNAIIDKIEDEKDSWADKNVWIDPALKMYTVPLHQRKASDGVLTLGRGSRIPLDIGKVLRLFVYWKNGSERTDLDLSAIKYDSNMERIGHVSYTCLKSDGMVHSGDIQDGSKGAAEFIDINLATLKKNSPGARYIATTVHKYAGNNFIDCVCHSGWMVRSKVSSRRRSFDIKTVQNKFDLNGVGSYAIPILVDLQENEIIFIDLYVGRLEQSHRRVENSYEDIGIVSRELARMNVTRPNLYNLAQYNVVGRKAALNMENKEEADITIGVEECDYNARDVEKILTEFI